MDTNEKQKNTYSFSQKHKASIYLSVLIFSILPFSTIYVGIIDRSTPNPNAPFVIALSVLFFLLSIYSISILPRLHSKLILTDEQIIQQFRDGKQISIDWGEIIRITNRSFLGRLEIHSKEAKRVIFVEYQIQGYNEIVNQILFNMRVKRDIMQVQIVDMWSPDLVPPSSGLPEDPENFFVLIQVSLTEKGQNWSEVFSLYVCSPSAIAKTASDTFIQNTLVLDRFSWEAVKNRIEKLLLHCQSCRSWDEVIQSLCGFLYYDD